MPQRLAAHSITFGRASLAPGLVPRPRVSTWIIWARRIPWSMEPHPGLLVAVAADWLLLAIAEAILEFENDVLDGALLSCATCRHGPFEFHS